MTTTMLADPVLVCREILLADPDVRRVVDDRVYGTPDLPPGHRFPCVRLTHVGASGHAPVPFRHSLSAVVQVDVWASTMTVLHLISETVLAALTVTPTVPGVTAIRAVSEAREIDETAQPPLYRYRAQLTVRIVRTPTMKEPA